MCAEEIRGPDVIDCLGFRVRFTPFRSPVACIHHIYTPWQHLTPLSGCTLVCIRENTEGEYSGLEHEVVPDVVESLKVITSDKSRRYLPCVTRFPSGVQKVCIWFDWRVSGVSLACNLRGFSCSQELLPDGSVCVAE